MQRREPAQELGLVQRLGVHGVEVAPHGPLTGDLRLRARRERQAVDVAPELTGGDRSLRRPSSPPGQRGSARCDRRARSDPASAGIASGSTTSLVRGACCNFATSELEPTRVRRDRRGLVVHDDRVLRTERPRSLGGARHAPAVRSSPAPPIPHPTTRSTSVSTSGAAANATTSQVTITDRRCRAMNAARRENSARSSGGSDGCVLPQTATRAKSTFTYTLLYPRTGYPPRYSRFAGCTPGGIGPPADHAAGCAGSSVERTKAGRTRSAEQRGTDLSDSPGRSSTANTGLISSGVRRRDSVDEPNRAPERRIEVRGCCALFGGDSCHASGKECDSRSRDDERKDPFALSGLGSRRGWVTSRVAGRR